MSTPTDHAGRFPLLPALSHIYYLLTCEDVHSDRWDLISCHFDRHSSCNIWECGALVLRPSGLGFFFSFHKGCEEILPVASCFWKGSYVQNLFLQYPPQDLSRGQQSLTATQVPVNTSGQVVVTGNVQVMAALLHAQLWFHLQPEP